MFQYPEEMTKWRKRADWLYENFITNTKQAKESLAELMAFANGDSTTPVLTHYCLIGQSGRPDCCSSDAEAICKWLSHCIPFLCRGYQCPLLYRMKHYGPASSFVMLTTCFFRILPNVLGHMEASTGNLDEDMETLVDTLLADIGVGSSGAAADFQHLLADALDAQQNYQLQNSVRRKMMIQEVCKPGFEQSSMVIDALINPMEVGVNKMLGHTKCLHDLAFVGAAHPQGQELQEKTKRIFLEVVSGDFGHHLMCRYVTFLNSGLWEANEMGLEATGSRLDHIFKMVIIICTDIWRRFVYDFTFPPWTLFGLIGLSTEEFVRRWDDLEKSFAKCCQCMDIQLTAAWLHHFSGLASAHIDVQSKACAEIQQVLVDIAGFTPLTSDVVELKNGQTQWSVSKRGRVSVKNPRSATETTLLQSVLKQHVWIKEVVGAETLPKKSVSSGILKMVGTNSSNQHRQQAREFNSKLFYILYSNSFPQSN